MMRSAVATVAAVVLPFVAALAWWMWAVPRMELVSTGDGRGIVIPGSGAAGASQLLMAVVLLSAATVASTVALWIRNRRTGARAVLGCALPPTLGCALAATAATPLAGMVLAPESGAAEGQLVRRPPDLGPLFHGPLIPFTNTPPWSVLPDVAGWVVLGLLAATATIAACEYYRIWPRPLTTERSG